MSSHLFIWNAHDVCQTRLCAAQNCPDDAMIGYGLCERHTRLQAAGTHVDLHTPPETGPPTLRCCSCHNWKPDNDFPPRPPHQPEQTSGPRVDRRGRDAQCRACNNRRRNQARKALNPLALAELQAREATRKRTTR